jgi:hypothetical protein
MLTVALWVLFKILSKDNQLSTLLLYTEGEDRGGKVNIALWAFYKTL